MIIIRTIDDLASALGDSTMMRLGSRAFGNIIRSQNVYPLAMKLIVEAGVTGDKRQVGFRAAWSLEAAYFSDKEGFAPYLEQFLDDYLIISNPSAKRHYTKMLADMIASGSVKLTEERAGRIAEVCFDHLIDPRTRVAVKMWAMEILATLAPQIDWVQEHLCQTLLNLSGRGSRAFDSRAKRIVRRLQTLETT